MTLPSKLYAGLVIRLAPRYDGNGRYASDNGTGEVLELLRSTPDGLDWYCGEPGTDDWSYIVHAQRLLRSEVVT